MTRDRPVSRFAAKLHLVGITLAGLGALAHVVVRTVTSARSCGGHWHPDVERVSALRALDSTEVELARSITDAFHDPSCAEDTLAEWVVAATHDASDAQKHALTPICDHLSDRSRAYCLRRLERPEL